MLNDLVNAVVEAYGKAVGGLGTIWVRIDTPNLTATGSEHSAISAGESAPMADNLTTVLGYVTWIGLVLAVVSLIALGALVGVRMRAGEGVASVGRAGVILGAVVLISAASSIMSKVIDPGPSDAGGAVLFVQSALWWYMGVAAVAAVIVGAIRMIWDQRASHGREIVKGLLTLVVVAGAGVTIISLLVEAADEFSEWILNKSLSCEIGIEGSSCFGSNMMTLLALTNAGAPAGIGALLIIILGVVAILATAFQVMLMVARSGMLVILAGILPLSASFTSTEMGKSWFKKAIAWLTAFILYKPAAAVVYATAFQLVGTPALSDGGDGFVAIVTGLMLMILALVALPALLRFVTPMVGALAGGAAGGAVAAGALAALPSGAMAVSQMAGKGGSGSEGSPGQDSSPGKDGPSGADGSQGGSGDGPQGSPGASGADDAGAGSGAGADAGAGAGSGAGAGAGAAAGGGAGGGAAGAGAGAGGGAAAAGSAAGPAGTAAGAAVEAGSKAASTAKDAAQQATGDATGEGDDSNGSS